MTSTDPTTTTTNRPHVSVIGAGIGGACLTVGLLKSGVDVTVFESASKFSEIGAGISFGLNAVNALRELGLGSAFDSLATTVPTGEYFQWRTPHGSLLGETFARPDGNATVHRARFLDEVVKHIPDSNVQFGKRFKEAKKEGSRKWRIYFTDGSFADTDVVIGADGIHSVVRRFMLGLRHTKPVANGEGLEDKSAPEAIETAETATDKTTTASKRKHAATNGDEQSHNSVANVDGDKTKTGLVDTEKNDIDKTKSDSVTQEGKNVDKPTTRSASEKDSQDAKGASRPVNTDKGKHVDKTTKENVTKTVHPDKNNHIAEIHDTEPKLIWSGTWAYRGLIPTDKWMSALGEEKGKLYGLTPQMFLGKDGHLLTFPIDFGKTINVVAFTTDRSHWPERTTLPPNTPWTQETTQEAMISDFSTEVWGEDIHTILKCFPSPPSKWALHTLSPALESYQYDGIVVMGDAAHGGCPHHGAMAGQAIEDGLFLSRLLGHSGITTENVTKALEVVDTIRLPRANAVMESSLNLGDKYELRSQELGEDVSVVAEWLRTAWDWIWQYDLQKEWERTTEELRMLGIVKEGGKRRSVDDGVREDGTRPTKKRAKVGGAV